MDLRQLRTFHAVAELGSLSKASDRLRVAQPALSRQIRLLEHELKTELFVRNGRGMALTSAGLLLRERTAGIVRQIEQVRDDLQSLDGRPAGAVVLGIVPTVSNVLSARVARRAVQELPQVALRIVESYGGHLVDWLHRGDTDLAIIYGPAVDWHLAVETLGRDDLVAVGPKGSGLGRREAVDLAWLMSRSLALPSHSHGLRNLVEKAAARKGIPVNVVVEADSFHVLTSIVEEGIAYTILPPSAIRTELAQGRLETAPLSYPGISRELLLASPTSRAPSVATEAIARLIRSEIAALVRDGLWSFRIEDR
ncbi:HTH-type transcriptional regulator GltC [Methylobacterium crusticola]|uniref:HTH-type transcriptional regulator GltC n=1 Tax=Methylobacterium crusticola TaxID=1697972 RepID=A0ABQ4R9W2_9HYPH|nr:LysR substrate-binding domain-containing protein [Methylobacterium crusticola]GJD53665.1 HTH-type transcriptional regulator GltC [Methylobacterium crusticola]